MLRLRCTAKVLKKLGVEPDESAEIESEDSLLGGWYINTFTVERRNVFIFVNEKTLLSFVVFGIKKSDIRRLPEILLRGLDQLLAREGFDVDEVVRVLNDYNSYRFTKTKSRKILGHMNDFVNLYQYYILYDGGLENADIGEVIARINRIPQKNPAWTTPIEMLGLLIRG